MNDLSARIRIDLVTAAQAGIYSTPPGSVLGTPELPIREVEKAVSKLDGVYRQRVELKLGMGDHRGHSRGDRFEGYAKTFNHDQYKSLPRTEQNSALNALAEELALGILDHSELATSPDRAALGEYDSWDVVEYEVQVSFPPSGETTGIAIHRRLIRSKVEGLSQFRVVQQTTWASAKMPRYRLQTEGQSRLEGVRPQKFKGQDGFRFDLVVDFEPMHLREEREIRWVRSYDFEDGDLYIPGEDDSITLTPVLTVELARMSVKFAADHIPKAVWSFENVVSVDRDQIPVNRKVLGHPRGVASETFDHPAVGYTSGIGWNW